MPDAPNYTLGIESATLYGSICLLRGDEKIGEWTGDTTAPLSTELLPKIAELLEQNSITTKDITLIAVCAGPGSFTGLRIGLSTAKALQFANKTPAVSVSLPDAMTFGQDIHHAVCVIPAGRTEAYTQRFLNGAPDGAISVQKIADIPRVFAPGYVFLLTPDIKPDEAAFLAEHARVVTVEKGIAESVTRIALTKEISLGDALMPIYARDAITSR